MTAPVCPNCRIRVPRIRRAGGLCHRCALVPDHSRPNLTAAGPVLALAETRVTADGAGEGTSGIRDALAEETRSWVYDAKVPATAEEARSLAEQAGGMIAAHDGLEVVLDTPEGSASFTLGIGYRDAGSDRHWHETATGEALDARGTRRVIAARGIRALPGYSWWARHSDTHAPRLQQALRQAWETHPVARRLELLREVDAGARHLTRSFGLYTDPEYQADLRGAIATDLAQLAVLTEFEVGSREEQFASGLAESWGQSPAALVELVYGILEPEA